jgi:CheY-like chemotaxis protein
VTTKLLAVDDSKTLRKVLEITFAGEDFQTELATGAEEALQKLRSSRPSVAVLDTALGGSSGYDLCQQLKSEAPELMVVLLSSKHRPYDQARGAQVGADDYIDKPFDTQKLIDKVSSLLARGAAPGRAVAATSAAPVRPAAAAPAVSAAPRPAVASAAPQRPAVSTPARPAPAPSLGARPVAPAPTFGAATAPRPVASAAPTLEPAVAPAPAAPAPAPQAAAQPRVAAAVAAAGADLGTQLQGLGLDANQVQGVLALSREVLERVVWEVVPVLAETLIKEEIARLTAE